MGLSDLINGKKQQSVDELLKTSSGNETGNVSSSGDVFEKLLSNEPITEKINTCYGEFEFKYPSGSDTLNIAWKRSAYMGNHPENTFDASMLYQFQKWSTLDILVSKPERFKDLKSWAEFPDQGIADEILDRGTTFCSEIRKKIEQSRPVGTTGKDNRKDKGTALGN